MSNKTKQNDFGPHATSTEKSVYMLYLCGQNIIFGIAMVALQAFWQFTLLVPIGAIGIIFMIARIFDAFNDPILGGIVQKTNPKKGKFKPWTFVIAFLLPIATMLIFVNINSSGDLSSSVVIAYAAITYLIWGVVYTLCDVPIFALSMTMEPDSRKRSTLIMFGRIGAGIAGILTSFIFFGLSGVLDSTLGTIAADGTIIPWAWSQTVSTAILMIVSLAIMVPIFLVKERNIPEKTTEPVTPKKMFKFISGNKHLLKLIVTITIIMIIGGAFMAVIPTFVMAGGFQNSNSQWMTILMTYGGIVGLLNTFFIMFLVKKTGKRKAMVIDSIIGVVFIVVGMISTAATNYQVWTLLFYMTGGYMIFMSPIIAFGLFTSDCIEYGHYKTGIRQEAVAFSAQTFVSKLGMALGGLVGSVVLLVSGVVTITSSTPQYIIDQQAHASQIAFWITSASLIIAALSSILLFTLFYNLSSDDVNKYVEVNSKENARFEEALKENKKEERKTKNERHSN